MELVNTHCHTGLCAHAEGDIEEYVAAAKAAGLTTLAFTDHYPLSEKYDLGGYLSVPWSSMDAYFDGVRKAQVENPEMDIILGCELDYLGSYEDRTFSEGEFDRFSLVLGSVHFVDGWPFDDPAQRDAWDEPGAPDRIWKRYCEIWCDAVSDKSLPFHVMSHPDLAKKFNFHPTFELEPLYRQMAEACAASGRMIELNTSGAYYACGEVFPTRNLLREFCRAGVPCTVGTDAHLPANVARDIEKAYKHLYEAGYRVVTVPTSAGDRRTVTIE